MFRWLRKGVAAPYYVPQAISDTDEASAQKGPLPVQVIGAGVDLALYSVTGTNLLAGPTPVSVTNTLNGKTLATLLGGALNTDLKILTLIPATAGIYWAAGNASASSSPLPQGGIGISITKTTADTLKFFAATTIAMDVLQEG